MMPSADPRAVTAAATTPTRPAARTAARSHGGHARRRARRSCTTGARTVVSEGATIRVPGVSYLSTPPPPDRGAPTGGATPAAADRSSRVRLADGIRRLTDLVVGRPLPDDEVVAAADAVAAVADRLEAAAGPGKAPRGQPDHRGPAQDIFPTSPIIGAANPLAPPVRVWAVTGEGGERELRGRARFGYAYEGPPTCVHGGVLAETFDEMLGAANVLTGRGGMTGTLTVRYRRPTPLLADLDLEARQVSHEGRKLYCWAGIYHRGALTAEADAVFITVPPGQMWGIVSANADEVGDVVVDAQLGEAFERGAELMGGVDGPPPR